MHVLSVGQSELSTHSGRQPSYGLPWYSSIHLQAAAPFRSIHSAFGPHGDGWHGFGGSSCCGTHCTKALPAYPVGQEQDTACPITRHSALVPHDSGHGLLHLLLIHACVDWQSGLMIHSGRQLGGEPKNSGWHWQTGPFLSFLQIELGPQGDGTQGSWGGDFTSGTAIGGRTTHCLNGSPVRPGGQPQIGLWLMTSQRASKPQAAAHGSTHFLLTQACKAEHSLDTTHSGRHWGGAPI